MYWIGFPLRAVIIVDSNLREEPELGREAIIKGGARIENCSSYGKTDANYGLECRKYNAIFPRL